MKCKKNNSSFNNPVDANSWLEYDTNLCFLTHSAFFFANFPVSNPLLTLGTLPAFTTLASSDRSTPVYSPSEGFVPNPPDGFAPTSVFPLASDLLETFLWLWPASSSSLIAPLPANRIRNPTWSRHRRPNFETSSLIAPLPAYSESDSELVQFS